MQKPVTDTKTLVERAQQGDTDAFGELYSTYAARMIGVCVRMGCSREVAPDIVHDAFVMAFTSIARLKKTGRFGEWLTTITARAALRHLRQHMGRGVIRLDDMAGDDTLAYVDEEYPASGHISAEKVLELLSRMPKGYRQVLEMAVLDGMSHNEIAAQLGIGPHTSSSQLHRAKAMLRRMLADRRGLVMALLVAVVVPVCRYVFLRPKTVRHSTTFERMAKGGGSLSDSLGRKEKRKGDVCYNTRGRARLVVANPVADTSVVARPQGYVAATDSVVSDSVVQPLIPHIGSVSSFRTDVTVQPEELKKKKGWKVLLAGSLGPALVQNAYRMIASGGSASSGDASSQQHGIQQFGTWEEYHAYLAGSRGPQTPADSIALEHIAASNTGRIVERERHDRPLTVGLTLTKRLDERWSIETGVQYTMLKSTFTMGQTGNSISREQRLHYVGVPLKLNRMMFGHDRWSVYVTGSVVMNIPVGGSVKSCLVADSIVAGTYESSRIHAPWQWTVGAGMGLQYRITPHAGIYIEPSFNYNIPSGSSVRNVWTERRFTFTMPFGLRVAW